MSRKKKRFPSELDVGQISADILWELFSADLKDHLEGKLLLKIQ
jgi:hypothetical protein